MQFKVFPITAMLLFFTNTTTLAKNCNNDNGEKWKDLGSDADLDNAFNEICGHMTGTYQPNKTVSQVGFGRIGSTLGHCEPSAGR